MTKRIFRYTAYAFTVYLCFFVFLKVIRQFARQGVDEKIVVAEPGDILARPNFNLLPGSEERLWGGLTGHIALVVKGGVFSNMDEGLGGIEVVEARLFNKHPFSYENRVIRNRGSAHFGKKYYGRRYLLKMHISEDKMKDVIFFINKEKDKKYNLFSSKKDTTNYNCATFVRRLMLQTMNYDIDCNEGKIIFPNDVINNSLFDLPYNRVRF